jgi:DNA (cytosine-5)-methyltransferase 1
MGVPAAKGEKYPDRLAPTRELLRQVGLPYIIENIPTAPLDGPVFCGVSFGLPVVRHRRFETSFPLALVPSACPQSSFRRSVDHPGTHPFAHGAWRPAWRKYVMPVLWPWMELEETHDAIPPAYTEWIGTQLRAVLEVAA